VLGPSSARHRRASSALSGKLALKVGLCLCAGQLIAGPLLATAAEAAPAAVSAKAAASVKGKVTETVSARSVNYGSKIQVRAKVLNPKTGKLVTKGKVRLQVYQSKHWSTLLTRNIASSGRVNFNTRAMVTRSYRSLFVGGSGVSSTASGAVKVTVRTSGAKVLAEAKRHTGALYKYAAAGPSRFDCSGFTMYVYRKSIGKKLPHKANSQQKYGRAVSKGSKQVGDLIVFRSGSYGYHAGIYAGGGYMYDSPHSGARVGKHKMFSSNYVVRRMV
jgi:cell wall-associated NlpC family hydrolase